MMYKKMRLGSVQKTLINLMKENPKTLWTVEGLRKKLGLKYINVLRALKELSKKGLINQVKPSIIKRFGEKGLYELTTPKMPKLENPTLMEIDIDLVRNLRLQGKRKEADALVRAHQNNLRKNKQMAQREMVNLAVRKKRVRYLLKGLCIICGKKNDRENRTKCSVCAKKFNLQQTKSRNKLIAKGVCIKCRVELSKKVQEKGTRRCEKCLEENRKKYNTRSGKERAKKYYETHVKPFRLKNQTHI